MKSAIALFLALALIDYAAAAVKVPWQPSPESFIQEYEVGEDMDYAHDEPGQEQDFRSDQHFGEMQQDTLREMGQST